MDKFSQTSDNQAISQEDDFHSFDKEGKEVVFDWIKILEKLKEKSNQHVYSWLSSLTYQEHVDNKIILVARNDFERGWINKHYLKFIKETLWELFGMTFDVIITSKETEEGSEDSKNKVLDMHRSKIKPYGSLNPNYTFESFIVGSSNQFAHAASVATAQKPGEAYNPLFIYGGVGLGKTHLLNAIGNYAIQNGFKSPEKTRVCSISAEQFTNEVINNIQANKMEEFRNRYRFGFDVLLIDDIQFIAGKKNTQEEFFHTLNAL